MIKTTAPGLGPFLTSPILVNFSASQTLNHLIRDMENKDTEAPWNEIIPQIAIHTIEQARRGEPVIILSTWDEVEAPPWILFPLLLEGQATVIFGEKGLGKSTLCLIIASCLILPWQDNPFSFIINEKCHPVLYLDWEANHKIVQNQLRKMQRGMGLPCYEMSYRRCMLPLAEDLEQVMRHVQDVKAEVIIFDSLGLAAGGELNDSGPAIAFFNALRQLNTTALIVGQTAKDKDKPRTIYGNAFYTYLARSIWQIASVHEPGDTEMNIGLFHRWANYSAKHHPLGFKLSFSENTIEVAPEDPKTVSEFRDLLGSRQQILAELKDGSREAKELAEALGLPRETVNKTLYRMKLRGQVVLLPNKTWGLAMLKPSDIPM